MRSWVRNFLWALLGITIVVPIGGAIVGIKAIQFQTMGEAAAQQVPPPERVTVAEVQEEEWRPRLASVGTVTAVQGTIISTESDGIVRDIKFEGGSEVEAGNDLLQLDVDIETAQLSSARASLELARLSYERARKLIVSHSISQADLDSAHATLKQASAQLENIEAAIAKKKVRAPFAGQLGIRQVSIGQFLTKGSPVVSLQSLDPVFVDFSLPQQQLGQLAKGLSVVVSSDTYPGEVFEGEITAINPHVDSATRNIRVQARLPNPDHRLRPGMFVAVEVVLARSERMLFIPATAVLNMPFGDAVFVIAQGSADKGQTPPLVLEQRVVRLGLRQGDFVAVTEGVKRGERVVSTGVFKLRPSSPVVIDNTLAPEFSFEPRPNNT
jgi:membrane fusion protein (multidrug efflux system)